MYIYGTFIYVLTFDKVKLNIIETIWIVFEL